MKTTCNLVRILRKVGQPVVPYYDFLVLLLSLKNECSNGLNGSIIWRDKSPVLRCETSSHACPVANVVHGDTVNTFHFEALVIAAKVKLPQIIAVL